MITLTEHVGKLSSEKRAAGLGYVGQSETRKGYTGYEKDTESGLDFARARYYNPTHGRFTSVDPLTASATIRNPQTFNRYTYVLNSPYNFTDPLGLIPEEPKLPGQSSRDCTKGCFVDGIWIDRTELLAQQPEPPTPPPTSQQNENIPLPTFLRDWVGSNTTIVSEENSDGTTTVVGTTQLTRAEVARRLELAQQVYNESFRIGMRQQQEMLGDNISIVGLGDGASTGDDRTTTEKPPSLGVSPGGPELTVPLGPEASNSRRDSTSSSLNYVIRDTVAANVVATEAIAIATQTVINRESGRERVVSFNDGSRSIRSRVNTTSGITDIVQRVAQFGVNDGATRYLQYRRVTR